LGVLLEELLPIGVVSVCCFLATFAAGVLLGWARRRPDLRTVAAYAALSPVTIPFLGTCVLGFTLVPLAPLIVLGALALPEQTGAITLRYLVIGPYVFGWGIQLIWLWETPSKANPSS
jgi:hypothetical protein